MPAITVSYYCLVCCCAVLAILAENHAAGPVSKMDYINSKWKERRHHHNHNSQTARQQQEILGQSVRVRHSRHPNLDKVLDKIAATTTSTTTTTTSRPFSWRGSRRTPAPTTTSTTASEGLFGDYDDLGYNGDELEYDDDWGNDEDDDKIDDDYDDFDNEFDDGSWQAEEATEKPETQSKLTKLKWDHYGTRDKVEESRRNQLNLRNNNNHEEVEAVLHHFLRVNEEVRCRRPVPKVISVQKVHPDPSKTYMPHCTVLHRCSEDTGCCDHYATRCAAKRRTKVQLYFYTKTVGSSGTKVEKLEFYNHTECACLETSSLPEEKEEEADERSATSGQFFPEENVRSGLKVRAADYSPSSPEGIRRCKCPEVYTSTILHYYNRCTCDCADGKQDCVRMKKGKEYFSLVDRKCIQSNECGLPACEYGVYLRHKGRCPKKEEKLEAFRKINVN